MNEMETAWLAGWIEGEGSFHARLLKGRYYPMLCVTSTDQDVALKAHRITGVGRIQTYDPATSYTATGKKVQYRWVVTKKADFIALCERILPHMGERRSAKIREVIELLPKTHYNQLRSER